MTARMEQQRQLAWLGPHVFSTGTAKVVGPWHDNRHTLVTEPAESGAGDEVIMSIPGHISRPMLSRYSHVRMEAKRRALDEIAARQRAADDKRQREVERQQAAAMISQSVAVQESPQRQLKDYSADRNLQESGPRSALGNGQLRCRCREFKNRDVRCIPINRLRKRGTCVRSISLWWLFTRRLQDRGRGGGSGPYSRRQ